MHAISMYRLPICILVRKGSCCNADIQQIESLVRVSTATISHEMEGGNRMEKRLSVPWVAKVISVLLFIYLFISFILQEREKENRGIFSLIFSGALARAAGARSGAP